MYYFWLLINVLFYHETKAACCRSFSSTDTSICSKLSKNVEKCVDIKEKCYWNCNEEFDIFTSDLLGKPKFLGFAGTKTPPPGSSATVDGGRREKTPPHSLSEKEYVDKMALFHVGEQREWYMFPLREDAFFPETGVRRRLILPGQALAGAGAVIAGAAAAAAAAADIDTYPYQATGVLIWDDGRERDLVGVASVIRSHAPRVGAHHIWLLTAGHNCYWSEYRREADKIGRNYRFYWKLHSNTHALPVPAVGLTHQAATPEMYYTEYRQVVGATTLNQHKNDFCIIKLPGNANRHLQPAYHDTLAGNFDMAAYYQPDDERLREVPPANWEQRKFVDLNLIRSGTDLLYRRTRAYDMPSGMSGSPLVSHANTQQQYGIFVGGSGGANDYWNRITKTKYKLILAASGGRGTGTGTRSRNGIAHARRQGYNYYQRAQHQSKRILPHQPLQLYKQPYQNKYDEFDNSNNAREEYQQLLANFYYGEEVENAREERAFRLLNIEQQKLKRFAKNLHS